MHQRHLFLGGAAVSLTAACSPAPDAPTAATQIVHPPTRARPA